MFDSRRIPEAPEPVTDEDVAAEEVRREKKCSYFGIHQD